MPSRLSLREKTKKEYVKGWVTEIFFLHQKTQNDRKKLHGLGDACSQSKPLP